jgi:hypothetical protein
LGDASVSGTKCLEKVAPDGAEVAGLELRAKVSDEAAGAVICLDLLCLLKWWEGQVWKVVEKSALYVSAWRLLGGSLAWGGVLVMAL